MKMSYIACVNVDNEMGRILMAMRWSEDEECELEGGRGQISQWNFTSKICFHYFHEKIYFSYFQEI